MYDTPLPFPQSHQKAAHNFVQPHIPIEIPALSLANSSTDQFQLSYGRKTLPKNWKTWGEPSPREISPKECACFCRWSAQISHGPCPRCSDLRGLSYLGILPDHSSRRTFLTGNKPPTPPDRLLPETSYHHQRLIFVHTSHQSTYLKPPLANRWRIPLVFASRRISYRASRIALRNATHSHPSAPLSLDNRCGGGHASLLSSSRARITTSKRHR